MHMTLAIGLGLYMEIIIDVFLSFQQNEKEL